MTELRGNADTNDLRIVWEDEECCEHATTVPSQIVVCPRCGGRGTSNDLGDVTEALHEDPDFREDYLAGVYDSDCPECRGLRVARVIDWDAVDRSEDPELREAIRQWRDWQDMEAADRRTLYMESGGSMGSWY